MATYVYGPTDSSPEDAGYDSRRLKVLSNYYGSLVDSGRVRAAGFLMARNGNIFAHQAAGKLTHKADSPAIKIDSIKRIASVSKLFTATAIMKLVEDGKIWLEQPVREIIREFDTPMHARITLWHLLTHTSGLPADPGYFLEPNPLPWFDWIKNDSWIKAILSGPIQAPPGANWNYSTLGYLILGEVISRVSGVYYNDYLDQEIFKPLSLSRTFIEVPETLADEVCILDDNDIDTIAKSRSRNGNGAPRSGGGVYSTLYDVYRLAQCFLNGGAYDGFRLLGRTTVEAMTRNQLENVPSFHWGTNCARYRHGLGWGFYCDGPTVSARCYNHEGWGWYAVYVDPGEQFIYISFSSDNRDWDPAVQVIPRTIAWSGIV